MKYENNNVGNYFEKFFALKVGRESSLRDEYNLFVGIKYLDKSVNL